MEILYGVKDLVVNILNITDTEVTYEVRNTPICQYDQHSRARVGVKFFDYEVSEEPSYVLYTFFEDKKIPTDILHDLEFLRKTAIFKEEYTLMSRNCSYKVTQTIASLRGQMNRRLKFCEEEFIVGLHWLLKWKLRANFDSSIFRMGCDLSKECDYSTADYLSNAFGCLFAGCGRWEDESNYATFNASCSNPEILSKQLGIPLEFFNK